MPFTPEQKREQRKRQKREWSRGDRPGGLGTAGMAVIRTIAAGDKHITKLTKALANICGGETFTGLIARLQREGYILPSRGGMYHLTNKSIDMLPSKATFATGVYTPPAPSWRRPGSCHAHIPSIAAGLALAWRHPC